MSSRVAGLLFLSLYVWGHVSRGRLGDAFGFGWSGAVYPVHCEETVLFRRNYGSVTVPGVAGVL